MNYINLELSYLTLSYLQLFCKSFILSLKFKVRKSNKTYLRAFLTKCWQVTCSWLSHKSLPATLDMVRKAQHQTWWSQCLTLWHALSEEQSYREVHYVKLGMSFKHLALSFDQLRASRYECFSFINHHLLQCQNLILYKGVSGPISQCQVMIAAHLHCLE